MAGTGLSQLIFNNRNPGERTAHTSSHVMSDNTPGNNPIRPVEILRFFDEDQFYECTELAREIFDVDIVGLSILDDENLWIRGSVTLDAHRDEDKQSLTEKTLETGQTLVINNIGDNSFAESPDDHPMQFYAGSPFEFPGHELQGVFYVMDSTSRQFSDVDRKRLDQQTQHTRRIIEQKYHWLQTLEVESRLNGTLNSIRDGIIIVHDGEVVNYNRQFEELWNVPKSMIDDESKEKILTIVKNQVKATDSFLETVLSDNPDLDIDYSEAIQLKGGQTLERIATPRFIDNEHRGWIFAYRDITENDRLKAKLETESKYDKQTGLINRDEFEKQVREQLIEHRSREQNLALLGMNVGHFSRINRCLGYSNGDKALRFIAERLTSVCPDEGLLCRFEGDKFIMTLPNITGEYEIHELTQTIEETFSEPIKINNTAFKLDLDIGVSIFPHHADNLENLITTVNTAMNHSSETSTSSSCQFYLESMEPFEVNLLKLEEDFRKGFDGEVFDLHYQPRITLPEKQLRGMEALIRWEHPDYDSISPRVILQLAGATKMSYELDRYVIRKSSNFIRSLIQQSKRSPICSINVSAETFLHGHELVQTVDTLIQEGTLPAASIELEITERTAMKNADLTHSVLSDLRDLGVTIAVDDFGTGYSSFAYLTKFPIDTLKIDRQLIGGIHQNSDNQQLVQFIVDLAHSLDLRVVAEGPEESEEVDYLIDIGCDEAQGFHFYRPLTEQSTVELWT